MSSQSMVDLVDILKRIRSSPMQMQLVVVDPDDQTESEPVVAVRTI